MNDIRQQIKRAARAKLAAPRCLIYIRSTVFAATIAVLSYMLGSFFAVPLQLNEMWSIRDFFAAYLSLPPVSWVQTALLWAIDIVLMSPMICILAQIYLAKSREQPPENSEQPEMLQLKPSLGFYTDGAKLRSALALGTLVGVFKTLWTVVLCAAPVMLILFANEALLPLYSVLLLVGYFFSWLVQGRYYPAYFYLTQGMGVFAALRESRKVMRGRLREFLAYKISFLPWYILGIMTMGLGFIYVVPYRGMCDAMFVRYADGGGKLPEGVL